MTPSGTPSVSIVVATHNRPDWLRLSMDSVLEQDYPDLELLVVDDGSTSETAELLAEYERRYPQERFRHFRHDNMGQARTTNRGYELARGELLGYLPDDDLLAPGAVSRLVSALGDPDVVCAYGGYRIIGPDGEVIDTIRPMEYSPLEAFRQMDTVIAPGGLVRREVMLANRWDPSLHYAPDFILWLKVGLAGPVVRVSDPIASWRRHDEGLSEQTGLGRLREFMRMVEMGEALLELPADAHAVRAEAFRNACIQAVLFTGGPGPPPGERFGAIDLGKPGTSALSSGLAPTEQPDERADEAARLWRELAQLTLELRRARVPETNGADRRASGAGLRDARELLRRVGALPGENGDQTGVSPAKDVRIDLLRAAVACEADIDTTSTRYLVIERGTPGISDAEFEELNTLGFGAPSERVRAVVEDRRQKLEKAAERRPSRADR
jgi:hypothetical protein